MTHQTEYLHVDSVVCISLRSDNKRRELLLCDLSAVDSDLAARCNFLLVDRDDENPARGCYTSHQLAWRELEASGARYGLVFEDDAMLLSSSWAGCKATANAWLTTENIEWTFFMLGWMPLRAVRTESPHVLRVRSGALTHAYIINLQSPWLRGVTEFNGLPIDGVIAMCDLLERHGYQSATTFAVRPMGVIQRPGLPSNVTRCDACHHVAWYLISCQLHKLAGSAWSNMLLRYRLSRWVCEHACTHMHIHMFFVLVAISVVLILAIIGAIVVLVTI